MTGGRPLPRGVVALLLGDVVGSTQQWDQDARRMAAATAQLHELVEQTVRDHGGVRPIEQGEGDSFVAAFDRASAAIEAALDLRDRLAAADGLELRLGVHAGEVLLRGERDYAGPTINRAARLRDIGHGGQILVSKVAVDLAREDLGADVGCRDLGQHRVRGVKTPEHVYQIDRAGQPTDFPPLRSAGTPSSGRPAELTSFIGRQQELADLDDLLKANRLVSLVGSGGCGKTRLATRLAGQYADHWHDGTRFVDLSAATTALDVTRAIAAALAIAEVPGVDLIDSITTSLASTELLLILDNCEQVIDAAASTTHTILQACPAARVLATSREPLNIAGESTYRIPTLDVVSDDPDETPDAVALFVDRARAIRQDFQLTDDNSAAVYEIVQRLDGIPLAIELAAARISVLSPQQIVHGLNDCFQLLSRGSRTALARQQTLLGSVSWSHDLLDDSERALLRRLSVFVAGFDLSGAEDVCAFEPLHRHDILDVLTSLVDRSLVTADMTARQQHGRYRLLETIRQYAADRLADAGEETPTRNRHLDHCLALVTEANVVADTDEVAAIGMVNLDRENIYAALDWAPRAGRADDGMRIAGELWGYWASQGRFVEGRAIVDAVVNAAGDDADPAALGAAKFALAWIEEMNGDYFSAYEHAEQAMELSTRAGDRRLQGRCLAKLGLSLAGLDFAVGLPKLEEAIEIHRSTHDGLMLTLCLCQLGWFRVITDGPVVARPLLEEAETLSATRQEKIVNAQAKVCLGWTAIGTGDLELALQYAEAARDLCEQTGNTYFQSISLWLIAAVLLARGDIDGGSAATTEGDAVMPLGINFATAAGHCYRAQAALMRGELEAAIAVGHAALEAAVAFGPWMADMWRLQAFAVLTRANVRLGDLAAARAAADGGLEIVGRGRIVYSSDVMTAAAAGLARLDGDPQRAESLLRDALTVQQRAGMYGAAADILELLAALAADEKDDRAAARLAGAAARQRQQGGRAGFYTDPIEPAVLDGARERLGEDAFAAAWAEGEALSIEEAVEAVIRGRGKRKRPATGWPSLTPTELKVVNLVAEGLSNAEVSERLFISRRTVDAHLAHVYAKLGFNSRTELVAAVLKRDR